jgi:hypothetical protein
VVSTGQSGGIEKLKEPVIMITLLLRPGMFSAIQVGFGRKDSFIMEATKSHMTSIVAKIDVFDREGYGSG